MARWKERLYQVALGRNSVIRELEHMWSNASCATLVLVQTLLHGVLSILRSANMSIPTDKIDRTTRGNQLPRGACSLASHLGVFGACGSDPRVACYRALQTLDFGSAQP